MVERGWRRIGHCLNKGFRVQAPDEMCPSTFTSLADRLASFACSLSRLAPYASEYEYACSRASSRQAIQLICARLVANAQTDSYKVLHRNHLILINCRDFPAL